jgi:hypothetical protein
LAVSEPTPVESAAGMRPKVAMSAVMIRERSPLSPKR